VAQTGGIENLAILCGGGSLPRALADAYPSAMTIGFKGLTPPAPYIQHWLSIGCLGTLIRVLKKHQIRHVTMAGYMRRPDLWSLRLDRQGFVFLKNFYKNPRRGDNQLLTSALSFLEGQGFTVRGAHEILPELLMPEGVLGRHQPTPAAITDTRLGMEAVLTLGRLDMGQALVVEQGRILGVEGVEGTDNLMRRLKPYTKGQAVLIKACKPNQDTRADLPAMGQETILTATENGIAHIAVQAGKSLLLEADRVIEAADKHGLSVVGIR
jgi:UDP-2,3-diacylglucosamine hydrolase